MSWVDVLTLPLRNFNGLATLSGHSIRPRGREQMQIAGAVGGRRRRFTVVLMVACGLCPALASATNFSDTSHHRYSVAVQGNDKILHSLTVTYHKGFLRCSPEIISSYGVYEFKKIKVHGKQFHATVQEYLGDATSITTVVQGRILDRQVRGSTSLEETFEGGPERGNRKCWSGKGEGESLVPFTARTK